MAIAKPFIKWVGGKGQLLCQLEALLPADFDGWDDVTYIEPFVGGGAMLFFMMQRHPNIERAIINDVNPDLTTCYRTVRDHVEQLLPALRDIQSRYCGLADMESKQEMFLSARRRYNGKGLGPIENTALFLFLNRTCFNGLYRVNRKGMFNVPFGKYAQPKICDEETLRADSELLKRVEILEGDFEQTLGWGRGRTLFYLDPPYRPLSVTSNFNSYAKDAFDDSEQTRLKEFCDRVAAGGHRFMLSNSDSRAAGGGQGFFDLLYAGYPIARVMAARNVNSNGAGRGKITEIVVRNYTETKGRGATGFTRPGLCPSTGYMQSHAQGF